MLSSRLFSINQLYVSFSIFMLMAYAKNGYNAKNKFMLMRMKLVTPGAIHMLFYSNLQLKSPRGNQRYLYTEGHEVTLFADHFVQTSFLNCLVNRLFATRWLGSRFLCPVSQFFSKVLLYVACSINTVIKKLRNVHKYT